ncbi:MAG: triphosphoribosyl-dephospho-CoA synthase MdcB [Reyranella sp.]|nr:triphosphoribosyl-dephospho-CoA synthase MdcB [Reyranella sp.]
MNADAGLLPHGVPTDADLALAKAAVAALRDELKAYPKPGLVSPFDSGAHADMDFALMCTSADALLQPLASLAAAGREGRSFQAALMPLGIEAERRMLVATDGVNTHRGAIFSMGLIVAAIARASALSARISPLSVRTALKREWGDALEAHAAGGSTAASHGALVRRKTGHDGARREAALAFPSVFGVGVPALRRALEAGLDANAASIQTLFTLMEAVDDTTVLYRGGLDAGAFVRRSAAIFLADGGCFQADWRERAERLHRSFVERNVSAGGCADLLACTLLVSRCGGGD